MPSDQQAFVGPRIWDQPRASLVAPDGKESACNAGDPGSIELVVKICKKKYHFKSILPSKYKGKDATTIDICLIIHESFLNQCCLLEKSKQHQPDPLFVI